MNIIDTELTPSYLVSICIPTYNEPILFKRCLDSILIQDYQHIEIIISDDSTSPEVKLIKEQISSCFVIRYKSNNPALKSPRNWNNALDMATGDLVLLMHHDDYFTNKNSVSSFVEIFEKDKSINVVFSSPFNTYDSKKSNSVVLTSKSFLKLKKLPHRLFVSNILGDPSNVMLKKNNIRYREDLIWMVDMEYYFRNFIGGLNITYIAESLVTTGVHQNQVTNFCMSHPGISLREHMLVCSLLPEDLFKDIVLYDHYWRQLRNNKVRSINDLIFQGVNMPRIINHMLQFLVFLPVKSTFNGILSKTMMFLSYISWHMYSKYI